MRGLKFPSETQDMGSDVVPAVDSLLSIVYWAVFCDTLKYTLICCVWWYSLKSLDSGEGSTCMLFFWIKLAK